MMSARAVPNAVFDEAYYLGQLSTPLRDQTAWEHYEAFGASAGLSPSPYFDVTWYKLTNRDLSDFQGNIVAHYLEVGRREHKDPHPVMRMHSYWDRYLKDNAPDADPLEHYATVGWHESHRINALFWPDWYAETYMGKSRGKIDPFLHYLLSDPYRNAPNPVFDPEYYAVTTHAGEAIQPDPLSHYLHVGWRQGASPHALFRPDHYLDEAGVQFEDLEISPLEHFLSNPRDIDPHPLFNSAFYREQMARRESQMKEGPALVTYVQRGHENECDPHPFFSSKHYYEKCLDVKQSKSNPLIHYVRSGGREGREFHPLFDVDFYSQATKDDGYESLLEHYLTIGFHDGRSCRGPEQPDVTIRPLPTARTVVDLPVNEVVNGGGTAAEEKKIGAFLHIFYPDLAREMIEATNNIGGDCTLFISTDSLLKLRSIRETCEEISRHPYEIRITPNRGRDIAPMLVGFADRLRQVDYGVHIHSKRSRHYKKEFESWRRYLIQGNLGSPELVENILGLLSRREIGAVMPEHYYPIRSLIQWGGNFKNVQTLVEMAGDQLCRENVLDFPSGSMFWFKTDALKDLLNLELSLEHFDPENGQVDGTLAHSIERAFFLFVEIAGYEYAVINPVTKKGATAPGARVGNRFYPTKRDRGHSSLYFPETTRFMLRTSKVAKPRFNLLIPTVDTSVGYAGVSTAIDVFQAIREELGDDFDGQMIATDVSPGNQYCPPDGYEMRGLADRDAEGVDTVVDAAVRYRCPYFVREQDFFLATAWWTARNGFEVNRMQAALFGSKVKPVSYMIQDNENGFYPWSTKYVLSDATYRRADVTIPIFNTDLLFDDFKARGYYDRGHVLKPGINKAYLDAIEPNTRKEKIVLLYARPHAERNCLPFVDIIVNELFTRDRNFWSDWRFLAVGEDFEPETLRSNKIEVLGRLTIEDYAKLSSRAALAMSLMVSPHPSYPPLEMADAGVLVLTNTYDRKDLSELHENIESFTTFDIEPVVNQFHDMAVKWQNNPQQGWASKPKTDWFFQGKSNLPEVAQDVAKEIRKHL